MSKINVNLVYITDVFFNKFSYYDTHLFYLNFESFFPNTTPVFTDVNSNNSFYHLKRHFRISISFTPCDNCFHSCIITQGFLRKQGKKHLLPRSKYQDVCMCVFNINMRDLCCNE